MKEIVIHPIGDNQLRINNKEFVGLDIDKILTGVENPTKTEILKNPNTGLNYSRNAVEAVEVYNFHTQKHHNWFILDLETGGRGWYPGCVIHGDILGTNVPIYEEPNEESTILKTVSGITVTVLEIDAIDQEPSQKGWYKIKYDITGYVKEEVLSNLRYENPF